MSVTHIQQAAEKRRSIYALNKQLPVPAADVVKIIEHAVKHTPSSTRRLRSTRSPPAWWSCWAPSMKNSGN